MVENSSMWAGVAPKKRARMQVRQPLHPPQSALHRAAGRTQCCCARQPAHLPPCGGTPDGTPSVQAITYNNLGCLFKRRNMPQVALQVGAQRARPPARRAAPACVQLQALCGSALAVASSLFHPGSHPCPLQPLPQYLQKALALEESMGGSVQNRSSTHLNICAAASALKRPKEVGARCAGEQRSAGCLVGAPWRNALAAQSWGDLCCCT